MDIADFERFASNKAYDLVPIHRLAISHGLSLLDSVAFERLKRVHTLEIRIPGNAITFPCLSNITLLSFSPGSRPCEQIHFPPNLVNLEMWWNPRDPVVQNCSHPLKFPESLTRLKIGHMRVPMSCLRSLPCRLQELGLFYPLGLDGDGCFGFTTGLPPSLVCLTLEASNTTSLADIVLPPRLEEFHLSGTRILSIPVTYRFPQTLRTLSLAGNKDFKAVHRRLPFNLEGLDLSCCLLTPRVIAMVKFPASIQRLNLAGNHLPSLTFLESLPPTLIDLNMSNNELTYIGGSLVFPSSLRVLSLDSNPDLFIKRLLRDLKLPRHLRTLSMRDTGITSLKGLRIPQNLRSLDVSANNITVIDNFRAPLLEVLHLGGNPLQDISFCDWTTPSCLHRLVITRLPIGFDIPVSVTHLSVRGCSDNPSPLFFDVGASRVSILRVRFPENLEELEVMNCQLDRLVPFPKSLKRLDLLNNQISSISDAEFPPRLEELNLSLNRLTSVEGVVLPASLKFLYARDNEISSMSGFVLPKKLQILDLSNNGLLDIGLGFPRSVLVRH
ncbi:hypothetical protein BABINDRAFT_161325 [Babjeviella inositovora NRRL Y-12698]|uniref:L domain-like protein n=1 Tax=Babjeviella inositovora NRRL Y-12698 TaxID=984486 RepID=A0A1E3QTV8_9ASCO|nr:uncharacterized protein BABINDRAFT_161325 [Babjeviella inositovora NRRL Y-12698]ODQ80377.1 hypothetical protein BABINDRAFT_161325 [Babjeviella inositovora NRRL Y-12698]